MTMSHSEIDEFLREKRIAVIGTIRKDGSPHLTSMWYGYDGQTITFNIGKDSVKAFNVRQDNRVSIMFDQSTEPYKGVRIDGTGDLEPGNVIEEYSVIAGRYVGQEAGRKFAVEGDDGNGIILRVTPQRYYSWDFSK